MMKPAPLFMSRTVVYIHTRGGNEVDIHEPTQNSMMKPPPLIIVGCGRVVDMSKDSRLL